MSKEILKYHFSNSLLVLFLLCLSFLLQAQQGGTAGQAYRKAVVYEGIQVLFSIDHIDQSKVPGLFKEGDDVRFRFSITDTLTKSGLSGAFPAAWMDPIPAEDEACIKKVATYITGSILKKPELNLNVYYVLTMNTEPTIAVVDPLFGYGGSQLLALIELNSPGMDWVASEDQSYVFVSMPLAKQVAVIRTADWKVISNIDLPSAPNKLFLQNNGKQLWVGCESGGENDNPSGLACIDLETNTLKSFIPTGKGTHDIIMHEDGQFVFATNSDDNSLSVIDAYTLEKIKDIPICQKPSSLDYSEEAQAIYVISEETGELSIIDAQNHALTESLQLEAGICQIKFEPNKRYAFIVNPKKDNLSILDASINKVVQVGDMESEPDQVNFTETLAYIRHRNSELILMIPLANIGNEKLPVTVIDFPGGQYPAGKMSLNCLADGIVQTPGESAVLVANAPDKTIYYYAEGMAAPMGNFNNYNLEPRSVLVIDRSLKEVSSGHYETVAKLRSSGLHDVAFFMDVPRFVHCFQVSILPDLELERAREISHIGGLTVQHLPPRRYITAGEEFPVNFKLIDNQTDQTRGDLQDVQIMCMGLSGAWHFRQSVLAKGDGVYTANVVFPEPGVYYLYVQSPSGGLSLSNPQYRTLHVIDPTPSN